MMCLKDPGSFRQAKIMPIDPKDCQRQLTSCFSLRLPGMLHLALTMKWINASSVSDVPAAKSTGSRKRSPSPGRAAAAEGMPKDIMKAVELVMDWNKMELVEMLG